MLNTNILPQYLVKNITGKKKPHLRNLTNDRSSGLPTLVSVFPLLDSLRKKMPLAIFYIDIENFQSIENTKGKEVSQHILWTIGEFLKSASFDFYGRRQNLVTVSLGSDDFLVFVDLPPIDEDFAVHYSALKAELEKQINQIIAPLKLEKNLHIHLGYAEIKDNACAFIESVVYKAIKEAAFTAKNYAHASEHAKWQIFKTIISQKGIRTFYQPIISLKNGKITGWEALSRGPQGSLLETPLALFNAAQYYNHLYELEIICQEKALARISPYLKGHYLFLNISPRIIYSHYEQHLKFIEQLLAKYALDSQNIVLELTERDAIENYEQFKKALNHYRDSGFLIAIDDTGAGYSSLQAIAETKPEFMKVDMSLIRGIDKDPTKKALLETLVNFSCKIGTQIICEGIETLEEFKTLASMGCDYGQGYFIAQPAPDISQEISSPITSDNSFFFYPSCYDFKSSHKIEDMARYQESLPPDTPVTSIVDLFKNNKLINSYAICENDIPIGLITRERLFAILGSRYGYDLFARKPVRNIMDKQPLILPGYTPVEEAASVIAARLENGFMDNYIIVTRNCSYAGIVNTSKIIDTLARIQIAQAKDAHPLTGLPGNCYIKRKLTSLIEAKQEFTVLYIDLDDFKAFNDYYGFGHGDRAITLLADIINEQVRSYGNAEDMVGHIGGDDFIVITTPEKADTVANHIIAEFDRNITKLYDQAAQKCGYIETANRQGVITRFPIMTLSIAGITNNREAPFVDYLHLSETAAKVKKIAKQQKGSSYLNSRKISLPD
ncbi:diguanylate cyclase (GGDEF) domain-containing protein [Thermosyntropha lipolytica DSM 11003]|uniref:Diguanylate cyclase (GGDEF) domain-containing protein n=1 Tax=Thermosyntropha lipolytica DSM 11003 TaxID=1123382 RepID=A0A1M5RH34_9FIRM|nr:EAL domain-containing protein [Thermosyntropha lipolytica]SHH25450.1 diguanylate cyclase (GGDEF) domain-containing protein [Thermosyntropha lipolytica DSM 11003]